MSTSETAVVDFRPLLRFGVGDCTIWAGTLSLSLFALSTVATGLTIITTLGDSCLVGVGDGNFGVFAFGDNAVIVLALGVPAFGVLAFGVLAFGVWGFG